MDTSHAIASSVVGRDSEDALKLLGRVADAFNNPGSLHKADKEVMFVVNVVKSRRLLPSLSSEESVCQDAACGSYDPSLDSSYDEDVEVVELGDVNRWEHASSHLYVSRRHGSPRKLSERIFRQDDGMYDITKMLLTSSPLDRLDRLARMELKKTGWFERADKWSVVGLGLQGVSLPITPPRTPSKNGGERREQFSSTKTTSPDGEKHTSRSPRRPRREHDHDIPQRNQSMTSSTPTSIRSRVDSQDLVDFSTLAYADTSRLSHGDATRPIRASRLSRTLLHSRQGTRGRLGQVVCNFVKRMLPPSSASTSYARTRHVRNAKGACGDSPSGQTWQAEMTPRSDVSAESRWTFASAGSWTGCMDYQATSRWSGFWHG